MKRLPQLLAFALGGGLAFGILQSLSACSEGAISGLITPIGTFTSIDASGKRELDRLYEVFEARSTEPNNKRSRDQLRDVFRHVRANYVYPVADTVLIDAAIKGIDDINKDTKPSGGKSEPGIVMEAALESMLASLDPHSQYLTPDELKEQLVFSSGKFGGLGIQVTMDEKTGAVKVISPIEDTPADRADIKAGDLITHINGDAVKGKSLGDAVKIMRGYPNTQIRLTIKREGSEAFDVELVRAIIKVRSVRWRLEKDIAYIRISSFTKQTELGLKKALRELTQPKGKPGNALKGAGGALKGIVLDLRNNPGGLLDQAVEVTDAFLATGEIVSIRPRQETQGRVYVARPGGRGESIPIVVLINEGSASASEIVAGALKDHARAVIMGRRSFGKGSVQTVQPMPIEGALQLTTALYYVPSGVTIQARGVMPDIVLDVPVVIPEAASNEDNAESEADDKPAAVTPMPRESDLPGALKGDASVSEKGMASLSRDQCPAVKTDAAPEKGDPELGCALAYLRAASREAFMAAIAAR